MRLETKRRPFGRAVEFMDYRDPLLSGGNSGYSLADLTLAFRASGDELSRQCVAFGNPHSRSLTKADMSLSSGSKKQIAQESTSGINYRCRVPQILTALPKGF